MLVSENVLFIHAPKTAGMAVTDYLAANLPGPKVLTLPAGHEYAVSDVTIRPGRRHENLAEAVNYLAEMGRSLEDFKLVLAVIRNPYEIEVSRYHYYRLGHPWDRGRLQDLALAGDFDRFCREALYPYIAAPSPIESYYTLDGDTPPKNMRLLRHEHLAEELDAVLANILVRHKPLEQVNTTMHGPWQQYVTADNEPFIFEKYRWLFHFYKRAKFPAER
jgi:hypothetical protein